EMKNTSVKGQIKLSKKGEVLTSIDKDSNGNIVFHYTDAGLAGAVYEIKASKDVLDSADGSVLYKKGTLMDTIATTADGFATSKKLPLGEYEVTEKSAPNGFTHSSESKIVKLEYENQETAIVFDTASFYNERQKVSLEVIKKDAEEKTPLSGAKFGIYAKEDITSNTGKVLLEKGTLIETAISNEDGKVSFQADFPLMKMEIKELKAPIGYATSDEVIQVDATYQGQDVIVIKNSYEFSNEITKTEISKQDITDESEIAGALLSVYPKGNKGETFDTWVSGEDGLNEDGTVKPHIIKGLEVGTTYVLHEESSPYGYAIANDIEFKVLDTGTVQKVTMKDEVVFGQLKWNKRGEIFDQVITGQTEFGKTLSPVWNESNLLGANIKIYAAMDIKIGNQTYFKANEEIESLESDWDSVVSKKLPVGRYYYMESSVPHGYIGTTNKVYFEVEDSQATELQTFTSTLDNKRPTFTIDLKKVLEEQDIFKNPNAYKDVVFGIFAREDVYDYMGNVAIENGTMIATTGINKQGQLIDVPDLPNAVYYLKELQTNHQYV
ncbi:MAG: prealbumin-like fold domain-containing protein, partial [Anaerorhabdus sp.]